MNKSEQPKSPQAYVNFGDSEHPVLTIKPSKILDLPNIIGKKVEEAGMTRDAIKSILIITPGKTIICEGFNDIRRKI